MRKLLCCIVCASVCYAQLNCSGGCATGGSGGTTLPAVTRNSSIGVSSVEASVLALSVPANFMKAGSTFYVQACGTGTTGVTPGGVSFLVRVGPTTLTGNQAVSSGSLNLLASATNLAFCLVAILSVYTAGSPGSITGGLSAWAADPSGGLNAGLFTLSTAVAAQPTATVAVDTAVANLVELTCATSQAGSTLTFREAFIGIIHQ